MIGSPVPYVTSAYTWLKAQPWLRNVIIVVLLFVAGYALGRYLVPGKIVIQDKVVTVTKDVIVTETKTVVQIVKVADTSSNRKVHRVVTETKKPDGTDVETTTEDIDAANQTHTNTSVDDSKTADTKQVDKTQTVATHTEIKTTEKPQWHLGANVGVNIPHYLYGAPNLGVPGLQGAVIGVSVGRRILGPVFLDLVGNSQGNVGLGISAEF
jgi:hypothetical protein